MGKAVGNEGTQPSDSRLPEHKTNGVVAPHFLLHGGDCCHTRRVEQREDEQGDGCGESQCGVESCCVAKEHCHGGHHALLCHEAGNEGRNKLPVAEAQRTEDGGYQIGDVRQHTLFGVGHSVQTEVERLEEPYQNRCHEDDAKGALDEVLRLVPDEAQNALGKR